ncbi:unnamed protein product [Camellia sinensis]
MEPITGGGRGAAGLGPGEVETVGEELAVSGGDESRAASRLLTCFAQSRSERADEGRVQAMLIVAGESQEEDVAALL